MLEEKMKIVLPQPRIELTTAWWSKKLMNFQLKLYHWATEASYRERQITNDNLKFVYFFISILLMQVQKGKNKQK